MTKKWNLRIKPPLDICPEKYCFFWAEIGDRLAAKSAYDSLDEALSSDWTTVENAHCTSERCCRETKEHKIISALKTDSDWYEPCEPILNRDGLPDLFFCNPVNLDSDGLIEYLKMSDDIWN